jgi:hypothetical protein
MYFDGWIVNKACLKFYFCSFDFITQGIESGFGVLIHCQQGVSRSASLVLAYLMRAQGMSLKQAYTYLKQVSSFTLQSSLPRYEDDVLMNFVLILVIFPSQKRPVVKPNANFLRQLVEFEKQLLAKSKGVAECISVTTSTGCDIIKTSSEQFRNWLYLIDVIVLFDFNPNSFFSDFQNNINFC